MNASGTEPTMPPLWGQQAGRAVGPNGCARCLAVKRLLAALERGPAAAPCADCQAACAGVSTINRAMNLKE